MKELFQNVRKVALTDILPKYLTNPEKSFGIVTDTPQGPKIVNFCSDDYTVVPNKEIYDPLIEALEKIYKKIEVSYSCHKDAIFNISFNFLGKAEKLADKDVLTPRMTIRNSYNGKVKYSIQWGIYRLVCSNGLSVPVDGTHKNLILMHTPGAGEGIALEKTLGGLENFIAVFHELIEPYELLKESPVGDIRYRIEDVVEATGFPARQIDEAVEQATKEMSKLKLNASDWIVYNALNYQLNHNTDIAMLDHKKQNLDAEVLNYLLNH